MKKKERERRHYEEHRDKERVAESIVEKLSAMKNNEKTDLYLQAFENERKQAGVPAARWKPLLTVRLTTMMKAHIGDLQETS